MISLELDKDAFIPIARIVVSEVLEQLEADRAKFDGRLAFTETEAAGLLGIKSHVLRDCRRRGEVRASQPGKQVLYERDELLRLLRDKRLKN